MNSKELSSIDDQSSDLVDYLASLAHKTWFDHWTEKGWTCGKHYDQSSLKNPLLVDYVDLSEEEKQLRCRMVEAILGNLNNMGYEIASHDHVLGFDESESQEFFTPFLDERNISLEQVRVIWLNHNQEIWRRNPKFYRLFARKLLGLAEPLLAYDVTREGLDVFPHDVVLHQLHALGLIRIGCVFRANELLMTLYKKGQRDEETLGLLASTYKDMARETEDDQQKKSYQLSSIKYYHEAYESFHGLWTGINLATMQAIGGDCKAARLIAREVCSKAHTELSEAKGDEYWIYATLGEAKIVLADYVEAEMYYSQASARSQGRLGDLISTRRNLRLLCHHLNVEEVVFKKIDALFNIPKIVVFSGHMIDRPGQDQERFPARLESLVKEEIKNKLDQIGHCISYSSLACGADILFVEAMLERNYKVNLVLPCDVEKFIESSVDYIEGSDWKERLYRILKSDVKCFEISQQTSQFMDIPFDYANHILYGLSLIHTRHMQTDLIPMVVWNKNSEKKQGGTTAVVENWRNRGHEIEIIDLASMLIMNSGVVDCGQNHPSEMRFSNLTRNTKRFQSEVMGLLFADTVSYSTLTDDEMIVFSEKLSEVVKELLHEELFQVSAQNSWGDALFLVFPRIDHAGLFALEFVDRICKIDWKKEGLSRPVQLRTALHAGIVFNYSNPATGLSTYHGTNVCRVARMESITPPGQVFCSQEFAALSEAYHIRNFTCNYVGQISMPKQFGIYPTYHVRKNY